MRPPAALLLLGGAAAAAVAPGAVIPVSALAAGLVLRIAMHGGPHLLPMTPLLLFAGLLAAMEWFTRGAVSMLGVKTVAVFLLSTAAFRIAPWRGLALSRRTGSVSQRLALFALFTAHFAGIFEAEARRVLLARSLAAPRRSGPGWFRSLRGALVELFLRCAMRAERFYAAQWLRGLGE